MEPLEQESEMDLATVELANSVREILGAHILKNKDKDYKKTLVSCLTALAIETAQLRWFSCEAEDADPEKFDVLFLTAVVKHFDAHRRKVEGIGSH